MSAKGSILAVRRDELDAALNQWKSRVEKQDAANFSVAGRMQDVSSQIPIHLSVLDKNKRTPRAKRFKGKSGKIAFNYKVTGSFLILFFKGENEKETSSTPVSPEYVEKITFKKSSSIPSTNGDDSSSKLGHFL